MASKVLGLRLAPIHGLRRFPFRGFVCRKERSRAERARLEEQRLAALGYLERRAIDRAVAFCPYAMKGTGTMVVPDASQDPRFADYPTVKGAPHVRFYAGQPLMTPEERCPWSPPSSAMLSAP